MQSLPFSPEGRVENLARLAAAGRGAPPFDLLVIGGGITGAGVARDAALRGFRTGLVERRDFAGGTSSRSSKLIHGGVRYLQHGDFALVRESAIERRILGRIAPHLVRPTLMIVPARSRRAHMALNMGLWTYERLGAVPANERHASWDRDEALAHVPLLRGDGLFGAVAYLESLTDDARLVLATMRSAHAAGACVANYAEVNGLELERGRVAGARVKDALGGAEIAVAARVVVNAAGPWVDAIRRLEGAPLQKPLHLTKGIHVTVPRARLPVENVVAFSARDRRTVFVVPRGGIVYLGTTDTDHPGPIDRPEITSGEIEYLLDAANRTFDVPEITPDDIVSGWAGLRPLLHEEGKAPSEISRRDEIMTSPAGVLSIAGGKLTTYRRMAERIVDLAVDALARLGATPGTVNECRTDTSPLVGGDTTREGLADIERRLVERFPRVRPETVGRIVGTYGTQADTVLAPTARDPDLGQALGADGITRAEVHYAVDHEMAVGVEDVLDRRTRALLFAPDQGLGMLDDVTTILADRLAWTTERRRDEATGYRRLAASLKPPRAEVVATRGVA